MSTEVHVLVFNERDILPWTLAHYAAFASKIVIHDAFSTDGSRDIARSFGAEVRDWTTDGINDQLAKDLKDNVWKGTTADWFIVVDCDELVHSPTMPMVELLAEYERQNVAIVKPHGFDLCADEFPTYEQGKQIYDVVKHGADSPGYAKPALFAPKRVREMNYDPGAHGCRATLANGERFTPITPNDPPAYMLHCKHLGPVDRIASEYTRDLSRLSQINRERRWGNFEDPHKHARDKRAGIVANLRQVIA